MDELDLKLSTRFMLRPISKLISRLIFKKMGYDIRIRINEIEADTIGDMVHLHIDVDAEVKKEDIATIIKTIGND